MTSVEGVEARRAALRMLDAVLRRGQTLDAASSRVTNLPPPDRALAIAIAGEVFRRLPDLDALIDSATRQRLADDSKARMVLRLALAQKIGLGTPDHALVSTALPLVDGGPRRLLHGVLGTLLRRGVSATAAPKLPAHVEERWQEAWVSPSSKPRGGKSPNVPRWISHSRMMQWLSDTRPSKAGPPWPPGMYVSKAPRSPICPASSKVGGGCRTLLHRFPRG